jgi:hypothetical protein
MSIAHSTLQDSPCAVQTPAGWFTLLHTPAKGTAVAVGVRGDFEATCGTCHQPVVQFWIDGEDDRYGRWSGWVVQP